MESALDWHSAFALLDWQVDLGADEAIGDTPVDRFAMAEEAPKKTNPKTPVQVVQRVEPDATDIARQAATAATSLDTLRAAMEAFDHCALKRGPGRWSSLTETPLPAF
jgi:DNA polymerase